MPPHQAIDSLPTLRHTTVMSRLTRKFIAVLMLLWLPIFTGSALAASVSMQMPHGECHESSASMSGVDMDMSMDMSDDDVSDDTVAADEHAPSCNDCGICHLACSAYLSAPHVALPSIQTSSLEVTPYLVAFTSLNSAPLDPPPLARV